MLTLKLLNMVFTLWAGLVLGVSFIATPLKFMAPHLTMLVALEVGKVTFHVFNKVEWTICITAIALTLFRTENLSLWLFTGGLLILLLIKSFYILPALDVRTNQVIEGSVASPGGLHFLYIAADLLQIIFALAGSWWLMNQEKTWMGFMQR